MKLLKQGHQMIAVKPSPPTRDKHKNKQSASLLSHNTSSESDSDFEHGKLMPKKTVNKFTLGDSDDDTEKKKTWETFIWEALSYTVNFVSKLSTSNDKDFPPFSIYLSVFS